MTLFHYHLLGLAITCLSTLGFGLFVLWKNPKRNLNRSMAIYLFSLAWWSGWECAALQMPTRELSFLLMRIEYMGCVFISTLFCTTVTYLLDFSTQARRKLLIPLYFFSVIALFFISLFPSRHFLSVSTGPVAYLPIWGWAGSYYWIFLTIWLGIGVLGHAMIFLRWRHAEGQERTRLALFLWGTLLAYLGGCPEFALKYGVRLGWLNPFGLYVFPLYIGLLVYAVLQHRFLDIQVVIRRSILYALISGLLVAGYFGLVYAAQQLFQMTLLQHHILALSLTAFTTFGLGLLVFLAEPKKRLNQIFGLYSLAISWWAFTEAFLVGSPNQRVANFWSYIEWSGVFFIAPTFIHTVFLSIGESARSSKVILRTGYLVSLIFLLLHLFSHTVTALPRPSGYALFHNKVTTIGSLVPLTFLILVNIALWKLWHAYRRETGQRRTQLKYLFWSSIIGYLGGSPDWFFVFGFHIPFVSPLGIYGVPMYSIATTYAVLHHRLFNVNLVIRKSLVYSVLVSMLTAGYFGLVYGIEHVFRDTFGYQSIGVSLAAFALMALAFQPLKIGIQRLLDLLIFRRPHEELVKRAERWEQEAQQAEKFKVVATLAAGMAHEIKNPLTALMAFAEFVPTRHKDPEFAKQLHEILTTETHRIYGIVQEVLDFAKPKPPQLQQVDLGTLVSSTVGLLSGDLLKQQIQWTINCQHNGATIQADPDQLRQVLINLIQNAIDAMPEGGTLTFTTQAGNGHLELTITDTGQGIPKELLPKIFDPFVTTKEKGTGLGLAVVHSIVQAHCGLIHVTSQPGRGTTFTLRFPL